MEIAPTAAVGATNAPLPPVCQPVGIAATVAARDPRPHWLLGPWMLHRLHLQCPSTMPLMMVYLWNSYCPFLPNILQLKLHSSRQPHFKILGLHLQEFHQRHHNMLQLTLHLHKLCRRQLKMLQLPFHVHSSCRRSPKCFCCCLGQWTVCICAAVHSE